MAHRPIYNGDGWVLGICTPCKSTNYVEPHGTTAHCKQCRKTTEHTSIPEEHRNQGLAGPWVRVGRFNRLEGT